MESGSKLPEISISKLMDSKEMKIPSKCWGGVGEAIREGYRLPPPFRESVANRPVAGDLTF